jgi:anti-sigma factor RsiW
MKDLPQYELIGAYLDGELDAAEAAQVERMLAEDPAARQLLDEFRALGAALKNSLTHQSLQSDISDEVLAAAERRLLAPDTDESEAAEISPPAEPWPRRLLNPRIWVWSGIAAALAVAIAIGERQQHPQPAAEPPRDLARATESRLKDKTAKTETGDSRATIQAAPSPDAERRIAAASKKAAADALHDNQAGMEDSPQRAITPPTMQSVRENMAQESLSAARPRQGRGEGAGISTFGGAPSSAPPAPASPAPLPGGQADAGWGAGGFGAAKGLDETDDRAAEHRQPKSKAVAVPPGVLVVHCNISPRAAQERAFAKLLTANGISWRIEPSGKGRAGGRDLASAQPSDGKAEGKALPKAAEKVPQRKPLAIERKDAAADDDAAEMIFAEATDAQLRAALAGLSAQPEVFLSFSIQGSRPEKERPENLHRGESASSPRKPPMAKAPAGGMAPLPSESERNVVLRRVLFVLRVVEPEQPTAAAKIAPSEKSQQAEQSPAALPPAEEKPPPARK